MPYFVAVYLTIIVSLFLGIKGQGPPCTGQVLGETDPQFTTSTAGTETGTSYILRDNSMKIPCCGVLSQWSFATKAAGDLTAQVWRSTGGNNYEVLGENIISGVTADNVYRENIGTTSQVSVQQDDQIGWHSSAGDIIPLVATGSAVMGRVFAAGKTANGGTTTWSNTLIDGEQWMFGATLSANTAPTISPLSATATALTSAAAGDLLHTLTVTDDNPDDIAALTTSILTDGCAGTVGLAVLEVQVASTLAAGDCEVVFAVVDHCSETGTATLTISVTDDRPVITSLPVGAELLREDASDRKLLHTIVLTNPNPVTPQSCTMTIDPTPAPFDIVYIEATDDYGIYYVPSATSLLDYDVKPLYKMSVTCSDGTQTSEAREFQVSITPNDPPAPTTTTLTVDAATATTTNNVSLVGSIAYTDAENDDVTFTMAACSCPFEMLPNGDIYTTEDLNSHDTSPYVVEYTTSDQWNTVGPTSLTITIENINHPPTLSRPTVSQPNFDDVSVYEHTDEGDPNLTGDTVVVYTPAGADQDGDTLTWDVQFDNGQGEELFTFDPTTGIISTKTNVDYETLSRNGLLTTTAVITANDGRENSETRWLRINVLDSNETPMFHQNKYAIETVEGTATLTTLACPLFDVTDEDLSDSRTYDINCGTVGQFHIGSGRTSACDAFLEQTQEYDLDAAGLTSAVVTCGITVTDKGGLTATTTLEITIHEDDDLTPYFDQTSYAYTITNDTGSGATFGQALATDDDVLPEHKRLTYDVPSSSDFGVDHNGIFFSKRDWSGTLAPTTRTFDVTVTDEAGHKDTSSVTVNIIDVPPTTTTTTTTTPFPAVFSSINSSADDSGFLAWLIPLILLSLAALALLAYMLFRCCMTPNACASLGRICKGGRCFKNSGPGRRRLFGRRVVKKKRPPIRVVRTEPPPRVIREVETVRAVPKKEPPPPTPPQKESSSWNCFKPKQKAAPPPETDDGNRVWHLWNHSDFKKPDKWVG